MRENVSRPFTELVKTLHEVRLLPDTVEVKVKKDKVMAAATGFAK